MNIKQALSALNPANDDHWTSDGLPRIDVVSKMVGERDIRRGDITNADPQFTREGAHAARTGSADTDTTDAETKTEDETATEDKSDTPTAEPETGAEPEPEPEPEPEIEEGDEDDEPLTAAEQQELQDAETLTLTWTQLVQDIRLLEMFIGALGRLTIGKHREREAMDTEIKRLAVVGNQADKYMRALKKRSPKLKDNPIKAYLERQGETRAERARRALAFIKAGTTAEDVAEQLRGKSRIDTVMGVRKPARGSVRPAIPGPGVPPKTE